MEHFFKLKENGTKVSTEVIAGITTFSVAPRASFRIVGLARSKAVECVILKLNRYVALKGQ